MQTRRWMRLFNGCKRELEEQEYCRYENQEPQREQQHEPSDEMPW
jgi:hypothetical protein